MEPINTEERQKATTRAVLFTAVPMLLFGAIVGLYHSSQSVSCGNTEEGQVALEQIALMGEVRDTFKVMAKKWDKYFKNYEIQYRPDGDVGLSTEITNFEKKIEDFLDNSLKISEKGKDAVVYTFITKFQKELREKIRQRQKFEKKANDASEDSPNPIAEEVNWEDKYYDMFNQFNSCQTGAFEANSRIRSLEGELRRCAQKPVAGKCPPCNEDDCPETYAAAYVDMTNGFQTLIINIDNELNAAGGNKVRKMNIAEWIRQAKISKENAVNKEPD